MDPRLDLVGSYSCRAAVAAGSVSIAVRAAHPNYRHQKHTRTAKAPDNSAGRKEGTNNLVPSRSRANADSAKASVVTPAR
jgi:hypothetical protein